MPKLMLMPSNNSMFNLDVDAIVLGIRGLSVNMPVYYSLDDIGDILKSVNKEIFICLNKNMHSNDLPNLEDTLIKLDEYNICGIMYYDIGVYNIWKRLGLKCNLVWAQEHMTTNYETINYWYEKNVPYALLSTEISKNEIFNIRNNTGAKLIVPMIGYYPMFVSKRHLIDNYKKEFNLFDDSSVNFIEKEGNVYPIVDSHVTTVYTSSYLNLCEAYAFFCDCNIDYLLINSFLMDDSQVQKIIDVLRKKKECFSDISNILNKNTDTFFLNKESIYKVK